MTPANTTKKRKTGPSTSNEKSDPSPSSTHQAYSPTSQVWQEVAASYVLCGLAALATRCWLHQFHPRQGASWQDPWWTWYLDYSTLTVGKLIFLAKACSSSIPTPRRQLDLPILFLFIAWAQLLQSLVSPFLHPWQVFVTKQTIFVPLVSYAWYCMGTSTYTAVSRAFGGTQDVAALLGASLLDGLAFMAVIRAPLEPADHFIASISYKLLPSGWLLSFVVTVTAALGAVYTSSQAKHSSRAVFVAAIFVFAAVPVYHGLYLNHHSPLPAGTAALNARLNEVGFEVLARGDGRATGYASVIQSNKEGFRALRCGHSLLGGFWLNSPGQVLDPIYGVFVILEAVRLIVSSTATEEEIAQRTKISETGSVLNIGLGIGTAPAAFIHHGMDVTIVEIDRVVYEFAFDYFGLPALHTPVIGDAIQFVRDEQHKLQNTSNKEHSVFDPNTRGKQYDFIVHDVFTGGVEPAALFTVEFLVGLRDLLRDDGSIAVNYAGDFNMDAPQMVLRTILAVFPTCRIFRESKASPEDKHGDQTNVVVFCRKVKGPFKFRMPTQADFLGAPSRQQWLWPRHEMAIKQLRPACARNNSCLDPTSPDYGRLLWNDGVADLEEEQLEAGKRHWGLMRDVIPPIVWDNW